MEGLRELGIYGLGVMGRNLAWNAVEKGIALSVYNRKEAGREAFRSGIPKEFDHPFVAPDEAAFVASLRTPRVILFCVTSGTAMDEILDRFRPLLAPGDILVDAGDSHPKDSEARAEALSRAGLRYVGLGLSGGAEGARRGPSLMAGGDSAAWPRLKPLLELLAAKAPSGEPCCDWMGCGGAGHFVKMVHNAVEYADMELIAESYHVLRSGLRTSQAEIKSVFEEWGRTELSSYLMGIAVEILGAKDETGGPLLDKIMDKASQKGSGARAVEAALELGAPGAIFAEAVFARAVSALKDERMAASAVLEGPKAGASGERKAMIEEIRKALVAAKTIAYAEGFLLLRLASEEAGWGLDLGRLARLWREGSIIRSPFLDRISEAYRRDPGLRSLILDASLKALLDQCLPSLRKTAARCLESGLPVPAFVSAISFYDAYRSSWLPANLLQALRDRFGSHGFERIDRPRGEIHHSAWR